MSLRNKLGREERGVVDRLTLIHKMDEFDAVMLVVTDRAQSEMHDQLSMGAFNMKDFADRLFHNQAFYLR